MLLYEVEAWTLIKSTGERLEAFEMVLSINTENTAQKTIMFKNEQGMKEKF